MFFEGDETTPAELYFGSDRGGAGYDIFVSRLGRDGTFGPAERVAELNSAASEQRPGISYDGREMYFTSNRPGSVGLTDIWVFDASGARRAVDASCQRGGAQYVVRGRAAGPVGEGRHDLLHDGETGRDWKDRPVRRHTDEATRSEVA